ncbi:MAG: permease [Gemmataceae bacterium]|nr:permease [Gemmataceae bacterium]
MSYGSQYKEQYQDQELSYAESGAARLSFIRKTYTHLAGAVLAFVGLESVLMQVVPPAEVFNLIGRSPWSGLVLILAFMGASFLANKWAQSDTSSLLQYMGLGLFIAAEAVIFLPILLIASNYFPGQEIIKSAGLMTLFVFGGLTISVFVSGKDYSFLGPILSVGGMIALGLVLCSILFGFSLGLVFSFAMVALMSGYILYETSTIMLHFPTDKHVAASLWLFSSAATLFYYILRILMALNSRE